MDFSYYLQQSTCHVFATSMIERKNNNFLCKFIHVSCAYKNLVGTATIESETICYGY